MNIDQDYMNTVISVDSIDSIVRAMNEIVPLLPKELRIPFNTIKLDLLCRFGKEGLYNRCNNQTVGSILTEYSSSLSNSFIIAEGELNGIKYFVSEPKKESKDDE